MKFSSEHIPGQEQLQRNDLLLPCITLVPYKERASTSQETGTGVVLQNLTPDGNPIPGEWPGIG